MKRHLSSLFLLLSLTTLVGCQAMELFHRQVDATPAPTAQEPSEIVQAIPASGPHQAVTETLSHPAGFSVSIYQDGLDGPRMMALGPQGDLYVAERGADRIIRLPDDDGNGFSDGIEVAAAGLSNPSSLAFFKDGSLYVGETTQVLRLRDPEGDGTYQEVETVISGLPSGGHSTRTVLFSPDWQHLFVSIGSSCNVCREDDPRRAAIMRYRPDGSQGEIYASGLRNAVGITFRPGARELWATNNGRDWLGDNQPPETVYRVRQGDDAGWPACHAARIVDPEHGSPGACRGVLEPEVEMQAHTAPLGLAFYTGERFPADYRGDLFVALHGSWNRTVPVGYKVVRIPLQAGQTGAVENFVSGWLQEDGSSWGRPVDILTSPAGGMFISDDSAGRIFHVSYQGE